MKRLKNICVNLCIALLTLVIMFLVAEAVVRWLYGDNITLFPRYHTDAEYGEFTLRRMRPHSHFTHTSRDGSWEFTINGRGLRNHEDLGYRKPKGTIRVLCLGDSHTMGYEVRQEQTFSVVIQKYLTSRGYTAEVINAGISGFSTAEELLFLENEGVKYEPDVVVVGFYANDFEDNAKTNLFKLESTGDLVVRKKEHIPGVRIQNIIYELPFVKWLSENSHAYSLLFNSVWTYFKMKLARQSGQRSLEYAIATKETFSDYETALTSALLKRMYNFCKKRGIKLIIIDIPRADEETALKSSFTPPLLTAIEHSSDAYIISDRLLDDYAGVAETHVPHGDQHISEFTHALLGVAVGKEIVRLLK